MRWRSNARTDDPTGARRQLGWFATLFAMALVFHYSDSQPLAVAPALLAGLPALIFPGSVAAAGLAVAAGATVAVLSLPAASNHLMLSLLVAVALGTAALWALVARDRPDVPDSFVERWLAAARTPVGLVLLVVYLFTVFDKLNTAYFTPETSCGGELFGQLIWLNGFDDAVPGPVVGQFVAIVAVVIEAAIFVLLAVPRLRFWGVLLGVGFHSILALASFYDFATVVFAVYVLLVPTEVFATLSPRHRERACLPPDTPRNVGILGTLAMIGRPRGLALTGLAAHVLVSLVSSSAESPDSPIGLPWHTLLVLTWAVAVIPFMVALLRAYRAAELAGVRAPNWQLRPLVLLLAPLLAVANGVTPYVGLKTVANYSMFSNLHTEEGTTNHLLPGITALQLADYQRDTVTLVGLELPEHAGDTTYLRRQTRWLSEDPPIRIPWLELRRTVLLWRDAGLTGVRVAYLHDGPPRVVDDATHDPVLSAPLPWWQRHLLAFRAVDSGSGPDICRW
ncbi:hypothetical protein H5U98_00870 [Mycolicibacterium boenickei]|uniref:Vitamin K-dependent gamma-carboxylase n=1 Tax=Mycolicibacterium boenickei TaxID=146017 RepID=A0AAX2ZX53_9MYCO|nr:hypothetical protein [Mycolicibacterium boenickei]PEG58637.1 hypothetical protein CQY21_21095 [Mycolicibacterium boenickei]UNC00051.1 hypothetical protein H5U98_00870 [Mycolicibacterium boenickei]BBX89749.1 hypothetical protein MBOE_13980 [Mycolicibacterium boenickei]